MNKKILSFSEIKALAARGQTSESLKYLSAYLTANPTDLSALKFYNQIRKKVYKENLKKVKESIRTANFMWKQKRYKELLDLYLKVQQFAPDYEPLSKLINRAYKAYLHEEKQKTEGELSKIIDVVKNHLASKNYNQAIDFLLDVIQKTSNPAAQKLLLETKRKIIDAKLKDNQKALRSSKIPEIYDFIKTLYDLEPTYYKIQKLLFEYHKKLKNYYQAKEHIYRKDSYRQIHILYNKGEYQKSQRACRELLKNDSENKIGLKYLHKSTKAIDNQNFKIAYKKLNDYLKTI